jgi:hypothetical protein
LLICYVSNQRYESDSFTNLTLSNVLVQLLELCFETMIIFLVCKV